MSHEMPDTPAEAFAQIVADVLEVDPGEVTDAAGPDTLPTWTSLRHLQLIVTLEETFGTSFAYHEIRDLRSIGDLRDALAAKTAA
jgi:acyl carrier protein